MRPAGNPELEFEREQKRESAKTLSFNQSNGEPELVALRRQFLPGRSLLSCKSCRLRLMFGGWIR